MLGELLGGFAAGARAAKNRAELAQFLDSPRVECLSVTLQTADSYALICAGLRRKGRPIPTNDLGIAASAQEHGAALLTRDAQIDGLRSGQQIEHHLPWPRRVRSRAWFGRRGGRTFRADGCAFA